MPRKSQPATTSHGNIATYGYGLNLPVTTENTRMLLELGAFFTDIALGSWGNEGGTQSSNAPTSTGTTPQQQQQTPKKRIVSEATKEKMRAAQRKRLAAAKAAAGETAGQPAGGKGKRQPKAETMTA